ncbi:uncharacterized protein LOC121375885 [Gigantopelta aegis]|uniref:uncharacterized protein LOC121375885 n=1 Tax=Gigantopelta aegis TaxID=1735272 RepID=UPI001B88A7C6|nr:uncharacterized protein LOC121375885 [Gigantopelta aegis]
MRTAYRGLCKDLNVLQRRMQCLLTTPQIQQCYNNFRSAVIQVVNIGRQGGMQRRDLEAIACNVSIARYQCETQVYSFCDQQAGEIMRNFFYAGLPGRCRQSTGVVSRYTQMWGGATVSQLAISLISLPVLVMFKHVLGL